MSKKVEKAPAKKAHAYIAKAPIRRLMKEEGASLVADDAVAVLIAELTKCAKSVTEKAVKRVKDEKRKRLTGADIQAVQ